MEFKAKDIDEALYLVSKELIKSPEYSPRGQKTKEIIQPTIVIANPNLSLVQNPARRFNVDYVRKELEWYLTGNYSVEDIEKLASMWTKVKDANGNVNSNYGQMAFREYQFGYTQYDWCLTRLVLDKDSRQAVINFNQPRHKDPTTKDFPCTVNTQYLIRNGRLIGITNMRSNDLIFGFCNDIPFFAYVQEKLRRDLSQVYPELKTGELIHTAASLHAYERHFKMLEDIVEEYEKRPIISQDIKYLNLSMETGS